MRRWYFALAALVPLALLAVTGPSLLSGQQQPAQPKEAEPPAAPKIAGSKLTKVTVYPGNALVTREVEVPAGAGLIELVVSPLPEQIVPSTMYSEGADGIRILTTRFRTRQVLEDVSEDRRKLEAEIEKTNVYCTKIASEINTLQKNMDLLAKLENFTDKTAVMSTEKGGLNGDTVITMVKYVMEQRQEKAKEILALAEMKRQADIQLGFLKRKMGELGRSGGKQERDAVIVVDREEGKAGTVRLNYLVQAVHWHPEYKLRAGKPNEDVKVDYLANLRQQSGEDWTHVDLTLSTAQPMLNAAPPELAALQPILVARGTPGGPPMPADHTKMADGLFALPKAAGGGSATASGARKDLEMKANELRIQAQGISNQGGFYGNTYGGSSGGTTAGGGLGGGSLPVAMPPGMQGGQGGFMPPAGITSKTENSLWNAAAAFEQQIELMKSPDEIVADNKKSKGAGQMGVAGNEGPSVTYHLPRKLTVPSRNDEQILEVAKLNLTPKYYYKAVPVLNRHVYRLADLANKSGHILLPGEATMYQGSDFVGRMSLPLVAVGEEFTAGFGVDPQLQIQRKLMDKTKTTQGGNQVLKYEYEILVSSFKDEAVKLQVWDRLPHGETETVNITLLKSTPEISKDGMYVRENRPSNLLRWDLDVESNRNGEKAVTIAYEFRMELDRQMAITGFQSK